MVRSETLCDSRPTLENEAGADAVTASLENVVMPKSMVLVVINRVTSGTETTTVVFGEMEMRGMSRTDVTGLLVAMLMTALTVSWPESGIAVTVWIVVAVTVTVATGAQVPPADEDSRV